MSKPADPPKVLVVDDDREVCDAYVRLLKMSGYAAEGVSSADRALELIAASTFSVIVSDIRMPDIDGMQLLRRVRDHDLDVPVILVTAQPEVDSAVTAVEYGAFRYLSKPVSHEVLVNTVERASRFHELARIKREAIEVLGTSATALGDRAGLEARFDVALERVVVAWQPIVRWSERVVAGYDALVQSEEATLAGSADLVDAADRLGRRLDLGREIRRRFAAALEAAPPTVDFFLKVEVSDLEDFELYSSNAPLTKHASRVVLEVTERATLTNVKGLQARVAKLRQLGFRIAQGDLGAGYAGVSSLTLLEPDYVKLDKSLVRTVDRSPRRRSILRALVRLCGHELGMQVVAEGIETQGERDVVTLEGGDLLQGNLFGKPSREFARPAF